MEDENARYPVLRFNNIDNIIEICCVHHSYEDAVEEAQRLRLAGDLAAVVPMEHLPSFGVAYKWDTDTAS